MNNSEFPLALKKLMEDILENDLNLNLLDSIITLLSIVEDEILVSFKGLSNKLKLENNELQDIINFLIRKGHLEFKTIKQEKIFSITHKGKLYYKEKFKKLYLQNIYQSSQIYIGKDNQINYIPLNINENIPSFIGCFIADKQGKTLLIFELFDGALEKYIKKGFEEEDNLSNLDIELIPMFVSALEKFSKCINIQDTTSFKIKGENVKLQTFSFDKYTVTCFINPSVTLKPIKDKVREYFNNLFEKYKHELELSLATGITENISHLSELGREMLKELNKFVYLVEFKNIVNNLKSFDIVYAKALYDKLKNLHTDLSLKFAIALEKVDQLKTYLVKTMFDEDLDEFKRIIKKTQEIQSSMN